MTRETAPRQGDTGDASQEPFCVRAARNMRAVYAAQLVQHCVANGLQDEALVFYDALGDALTDPNAARQPQQRPRVRSEQP